MELKKANLRSRPDLRYKSFNESFKFCSFALAIGMIYPNKSNATKRYLVFLAVLAFNGVVLFWFLWYTVKCIIELDIYNSTRNITIGVVTMLFIFKTFYINRKTEVFDKLLKQITKDLLKANDMEADYQEIYDYFIKRAKFGETSYVIIPVVLGSIFPLYASAANIYGSLKSDDYKKSMIHQMDLKFLEDKQFDFPYFELIFMYFTQSCIILLPNFIGFDGSFCIATTHLGLKLKLMTHGVKRAMQDSKTLSELKLKLNQMIRDHQDALEFYDLIQVLYGGWLFAVFLLTSFLISCNLYQIYLSGIDIKYLLFALTGVFHMYMPCYFASGLIETCRHGKAPLHDGPSWLSERDELMRVGEEVATDIYHAPWESWADPSITRLLIFVMTRAQKKLIIKGLGIVVFNMETFVSLLQTSYSFFTLITSK